MGPTGRPRRPSVLVLAILYPPRVGSPQSFEAVEKVGALETLGERCGSYAARLIAGCVRLAIFLAVSLLRSSSAVASGARGR